jgi:hypothetical protein
MKYTILEDEKYTSKEKQEIAFKIKPISLEIVKEDYEKLLGLSNSDLSNVSSRCLIGNDIVDYFTFVERLNTKGKYNANFYDFLWNIEEFKKKKFIQNMLTYYETIKNKNNTKNQYIVYKEVYNICISAINIFRPIIAMEIYTRFKPTCILDFTCGWGGRLVGAYALNIPRYIGIDINQNLKPCYQKMIDFLLKSKEPLSNTHVDTHVDTHVEKTDIQIFIQDALTFDYQNIDYDMVFTSPPYFSLEKYSFNKIYESKEEMKTLFYIPILKKTYQHLKKGGHYCLNVNKEIYSEICLVLFGEATYEIPLKKSKRQNNYSESIYVWVKP